VLAEYIDQVFKRLLQNPLSPIAQRLPSQCAVCLSWPSEPVCSACMARFATDKPRCKSCAIALPADLSMGRRTSPGKCMDCIQQPPPIDAALAALDYAYPWSGLISRYKFGEHPGWAAFFAAVLFKTPQVSQALQSTDLILPVPLSKERLQTRGFNQAWELAHALALQSGNSAKANSTLLLRVKNTRPQTELLRQERLANVKGAFQVEPLRVRELKGKRVLLVDDVMTSGASLFTAADALRAAGASHITGLILARTPL
jgi:ComF family protein